MAAGRLKDVRCVDETKERWMLLRRNVLLLGSVAQSKVETLRKKELGQREIVCDVASLGPLIFPVADSFFVVAPIVCSDNRLQGLSSLLFVGLAAGSLSPSAHNLNITHTLSVHIQRRKINKIS